VCGKLTADRHTNTPCGKNAQFLDVKASGTHIYHCILKGKAILYSVYAATDTHQLDTSKAVNTKSCFMKKKEGLYFVRLGTSQLQWCEQKGERGRKGSINRVLRAEHPLEIDSEVWWGVKKE
jgi:hypothetical protein